MNVSRALYSPSREGRVVFPSARTPRHNPCLALNKPESREFHCNIARQKGIYGNQHGPPCASCIMRAVMFTPRQVYL
jgi:hypothetical protein